MNQAMAAWLQAAVDDVPQLAVVGVPYVFHHVQRHHPRPAWRPDGQCGLLIKYFPVFNPLGALCASNCILGFVNGAFLHHFSTPNRIVRTSTFLGNGSHSHPLELLELDTVVKMGHTLRHALSTQS